MTRTRPDTPGVQRSHDGIDSETKRQVLTASGRFHGRLSGCAPRREQLQLQVDAHLPAFPSSDLCPGTEGHCGLKYHDPPKAFRVIVHLWRSGPTSDGHFRVDRMWVAVPTMVAAPCWLVPRVNAWGTTTTSSSFADSSAVDPAPPKAVCPGQHRRGGHSHSVVDGKRVLTPW